MASETVEGLEIRLTIKGTITRSNGRKVTVDLEKVERFADGTGANQIGAVFRDDSRADTTTPVTMDLDGLTDGFGATMSDNVALKFLYWENLERSGSDTVQVGGSAGDFLGPFANQSDALIFPPGAWGIICHPLTGWTITASTGDALAVVGSADVTSKVIAGFDNA